MRLTNERELIALVKRGDEKAFVALYNAYSEVLYSFLGKLISDREDIRDVVQRTFLKLWENREGLKEELSLQSYLMTIARNDIFNMVKKKVLARRYAETEPVSEALDNRMMANELKDILRCVLAMLPEKRREVFRLSRIEGYSNAEIAETLNISKSTVENHINHSTRQLRTILKRMFFSG